MTPESSLVRGKRTWLERFRALASALIRPLRGSSSGASLVEYLIITGFVALFAIGAFSRFGTVIHAGLRSEAKRIEGKNLPSTGDLLGSLGNGPPPVCDLLSGFCVRDSGFCFAKGTPVATESGDRPIESIVVGERVWSRDIETGLVELRAVTTTFVTPGMPVIDLELYAGSRSERVVVTPGHRFWVEGRGWTAAESLEASPLSSLQGSLSALPLATGSTTTTVYNIEVDGLHTYFVGHLHALVHNQNRGQNPNNCPGAGGAGSGPAAGTLAAIKAAGVPEGGSYNQVRNAASKAGPNGTSLGGEVNHMPAWNSWQLSGDPRFTQGTAPAIWMETADHRKMTTTGSSAEAVAWRAEQAELIKEGKIMEAVQMDIDEIREKYGSKYDEGIQEMLAYLASKGIT